MEHPEPGNHVAAGIADPAMVNRFAALAATFPSGFVVYDTQRRYLFVNDRVAAWSNLAPAAMIGRRDEEIYPPTVYGKYLPLVEAACATGAPQTGECTLEFNGDSTSVVLNYIPVRDSRGQLQEVIGVATNVTGKRDVEARLRDRDREWQTVTDNVPDVIARFDRELRHLFVNRQVEAFTELKVEDYLGKTNADLNMPADLVAFWNRALQSVFTSGQPLDIEFSLPTPSGPRHLEARIIAERGGDGTVETVLAITREITSQKLAQMQLLASEQRFRRVFESAPFGMLLVDNELHIQKANRAFCEMLGYAESELLHRKSYELSHPDDLPGGTDSARQLGAGNIQHYTREKRYLTKDGRAIWGQLTATAIRDDDGRPLYFMGIVEDITKRRGTELELQRHREHLEELVRSRTRALEASQQTLRSAERLASLGTLAAGIAHEINNPVGTILLAAEMALAAEETNDHEQLKRCLETITEDALRCGRIVKNILSFARQEPTEKWPHRLNDVVRQAVKRTQAYAGQREAKIVESLDVETGYVLMNPIAIEQALTNLLRNAIESRTGQLTIRLITRSAETCCILTVSDNGPGIPPEVQNHIFDPFFTTRRPGGGMGLGLSLVHGTILDHRGRIRVSSAIGEGTTFTIELPRCEYTG